MYDAGLNMTKVMYGENAIHIPAWFYVQDQGEGGCIITGATRNKSIRFGGEKVHQLVLADIIVRPHIVVESNVFTGYGMGNIITANHADFLQAKDVKIIINPMNLDPKKLF